MNWRTLNYRTFSKGTPLEKSNARSASHAVVHQLKNVDEYEWALRCIEKFLLHQVKWISV